MSGYSTSTTASVSVHVMRDYRVRGLARPVRRTPSGYYLFNERPRTVRTPDATVSAPDCVGRERRGAKRGMNQRHPKDEGSAGDDRQGGKMCQSKCKTLICKSTNGLQSRLRRFDSDPSLHEFFQEPE